MVKRLGCSVLLVLFFANLAEAGGRYDNRKYGFSIVAPAKWSRIPTKPNEKWIVARFKSNREYPVPGNDWGETHSPFMKVILFPKKTEKETGSLDAKEGEKDTKVKITFVNPYKTYRDYLKGNFSGGGYYVSKETQGKQGGVPVTRLEIKVEKLAQYGPQRIITWVFHAPIGDFAVQTDVLEGRFVKLASMILGSLKSFRIIKRDAKLAAEDDDVGPDIEIDFGKKTTPAERKKKRIEYTERVFKKAKKDLPPGWNTFDTKHFLVIYHTPVSKAQKYANQAEVFRCWLNKNFDRIGTQHVCKCILRICKNWEEEKSYRSSSYDVFSFANREITTNVEGGDKKWEFEYINTRILHKFFADKNELLWQGLPYWLERGLDQYLGTAIAHGKRLVFKPDSWEKENLRDGRRNGQLMKLKDLMLCTSKDSGSDWDEQAVFRAQCGSVVRFLSGPGNRGRTKGIIYTYLAELLTILEEIEREEEKKREEARKKAGEDDGPKTEEEEEEDYKKRKEGSSSSAWFAKKKKILEQTMEKTFTGWRDREWKAFDFAWSKWAK
ncbi:MAG: hypothetical protein ACYS47_03400 [Planctomycetota bacterium]|jgi:hypothetical protein